MAQVRVWRSGEGERQWLSMLVDAMEQVSREKASCRGRTMPRDIAAFSALSLHLARPALPYPHWHGQPVSRFSLRN
jgi:hypothetical protein